MLHTLWSVKGGAGVTVSAAALALRWAEDGGDTTLVDLAGDQPSALGLGLAPSQPGVLDWLASDGDASALGRLAVEVRPGLHLLPRGSDAAGARRPGRSEQLVAALDGLPGEVVIDAGAACTSGAAPLATELVDIAGDAGPTWLVTRACYLSLRRAVAARDLHPPDGIVLLVEPGRALDRRDVADVVGCEVVACVDVDPAVARAVDAGLLARRTPRGLDRSLRALT